MADIMHSVGFIFDKIFNDYYEYINKITQIMGIGETNYISQGAIEYGDFVAFKFSNWTLSNNTYTFYYSKQASVKLERVWYSVVGGAESAEEVSKALEAEKFELDITRDDKYYPFPQFMPDYFEEYDTFTLTTPENFPDGYGLVFFVQLEGGRDFPMPVSGFQGSIITENCTSDKPEVNDIEAGGSFSVTFTPSTGYEFTDMPIVSADSVEHTSIKNDDDSVTVNITNVQSDFLVTAIATTEEPLPQQSDFPFVHVYNPSSSQLDQIASKLIQKVTQNGTETTIENIDLSKYVVGLFKIFIPLETNINLEPVRFGTFNTFVSSKVVNQRYYEYSCGEVFISENYFNALDYSPHTTIKIWLPFIGFYDLDIDLVMNDNVEVIYRVDCITGKCVAEILNGNKTVIYRFVGMAYEIEPYYFNQGEDITDNVVNQAYNMSNRYPYFIIDRPKLPFDEESSQLDGEPTYEICVLGDKTGYVRCKEVIVDGFIRSDEERSEIETLLKKGVIL